MSPGWETELADFLQQLSSVQDELFELLSHKRACLARGDAAGLEQLQPRESELVGKLEECQQQRLDLLDRAKQQGQPVADLRSLSRFASGAQRRELPERVTQAARRMRLLQHQSLANWVAAQRSLLHVAQLVEIIATGGKSRPTYGKGEPALPGGSFVDQAV